MDIGHDQMWSKNVRVVELKFFVTVFPPLCFTDLTLVGLIFCDLIILLFVSLGLP